MHLHASVNYGRQVFLPGSTTNTGPWVSENTEILV